MTTAATVRSGETVFDHHTTETDDRRASNGRACLSIETPPRKATQRHERPCGDWTRARPPIGRAVGRWPSAPTLHLGNDTTFPTKRSNPRQLITIFLSPHRRRTATRTRRYYRTYVSGTERSPPFTVRSIETVRTPTGRPNADRELPRPTDRPKPHQTTHHLEPWEAVRNAPTDTVKRTTSRATYASNPSTRVSRYETCRTVRPPYYTIQRPPTERGTPLSGAIESRAQRDERYGKPATCRANSATDPSTDRNSRSDFEIYQRTVTAPSKYQRTVTAWSK
jgi:hypothetical protein